MSDAVLPPDEQTALYVAQQRVIVDLLETHHGRAIPEIEAALRHELAARDIACPPGPWVNAVASAISADRLYVVAPGVVPEEYYHNPAGERAAERVDEHVRGRHADPGDRDPDLPPHTAN